MKLAKYVYICIISIKTKDRFLPLLMPFNLYIPHYATATYINVYKIYSLSAVSGKNHPLQLRLLYQIQDYAQ